MSETPASFSEFGRWRRSLWPVHHYELKKLIPMLLIFFFISFDYNVLRTLKDSLLVTAKGSGVEVIPFAKVWGVFPGAIAMTLFFTWLSNRLSHEKVFYIIISLFLAYFALFAFVLYPLRDSLHPNALADELQTILPVGFKGLIALLRYWTFSLFYVMSELWSSAILFVLFWGFANQVTRIGEAKRFYGLFGIGANLSGIFAGQASVYCCQYARIGGVFVGQDAWHQSLILMVSLVIFSACIALALFRWLNVVVLTDKRFYDPDMMTSSSQTKPRLTLRESFAVLLRSRYLLCIALIVLSYNLIINLTEVLWKNQVKELYPDPNDYTLYMNHIVSIIGVVATLSSLFVSGNAVRKGGWTMTALLTPLILLVTSIGFFTFFFLKDPAFSFTAFGGMTPLVLVVFFGTAQNVLSRGAKYSVFDATKEMAFVPLDSEAKLVGKAAIDGVCSRMGKAGGSVVFQVLLVLFDTLTASAPYVAGVLLVVISVWTVAVCALGKQFSILTGQTTPASAEPSFSPLRSLLPESLLLTEKQAI